MTEKQAREELVSIDSLCHIVCNICSSNDWYCPTECDLLIKARKIDFDRIIKCYAQHNGDLVKVCRYIKNTRINRVKGGY